MSHPRTVDQAAPGSEQAFAGGAARGAEQAGVRRVRSVMHDVHPRQVWVTKRRGDGRRVRIRSVHRLERRVDVVDDTGRRFQLKLSELRRFYRQTDQAAA